MAESARPVEVTSFTYDPGEPRARRLSVPVETPVEVGYGGVPFAVMMLTPRDLEDFAYGFSLTEGLIRSASDIRRVSVTTGVDGIRLDVELVPDRMAGHLARRRALSGRTGCGVCGIQDLAALDSGCEQRVSVPEVPLHALRRAVSELEAEQALNAETRSVHAAGWADLNGCITHVREDVGRHNALDKLIGRLLFDGLGTRAGFIVITSRCSFEMVDKAAAIGAGMLVAVSGPTSLAIDKATRLGMALIAIAREDGVTAFTGGWRLADECIAGRAASRPDAVDQKNAVGL
ncbi:formate dehydrogenase accessory sulfurtransferase FdhD [uncultured Enterovirga sp.]|uniref:formate dehydrogenase accessory sulfurtransferase FdhD n=1 Tax=uncultured Enterovirga sp. TaxID=2026352 RepID=UPI0035CB5080